jgi:PAS domain S-box-containing protein
MNDHSARPPETRKPARQRRADASSASSMAADLGAHVADILASISDGLVAFDNAWRFTYINAAAERMTNRKADDLIGRTIADALGPDGDNPFLATYRASKAGGEPAAFTAYSDVFARWLEVRGYPHAAGYTVFFRDVSDERAAHRAALRSEGKLEAASAINQRIFETSLDLILVVDRRGNFIRVSPSSTAILGHPPAELIGRSAAEFLHADDLENTRNEMRLARRGRLMRNFECRYVHRDGRIVPLMWTGVWSEPEQQHFFIGRDMTERIALEQQLRQAQKMEAVGQLTGGVAHDFNNILTVITSTIDILGDAVSGDAQLAAIARSINEAAERGTQLTQRMLAFARKQPLQARTLDLNEIVEQMAPMLRRTLGEDIAIRTGLADRPWHALADPSQVEDAILNLALNARDAMPLGGRLVIETANVRLDEQYAAHNADVTPGDYVAMIVTDSGAGMSPDVAERAFEPFFTTKDVGRGTGLGLSMVYGFAKQSRGHVKIYSEVGHGTSVKLYLPRVAGAAALDADTLSPPGEVHHGGGETILVVEDDAAVRIAAVSILQDLGYRVLQAEDGKAALAILQEARPIDLLFTDLIMPNGVSGQDLLRKAREQRPELKVLFTSGYSEHLFKGRGDAERGVPLLNKPYRRQNLAAAIRGVLDGGA